MSEDPTPTPEPTPAPEPTAWTEGFDENLMNMVTNKGWENPSDLATSYMELEKFRGVDEKHLIKLPGGEEGWDDVYTKLGRPEAPDGYELGFEVNETNQAHAEFLKSTAHKLGLNQKQLSDLVEAQDSFYAEREEFLENARQVEDKNSLQKLRDEEWGSKYEDNLSQAREAAKRFGVDESKLDAMCEVMGSADTMKFFAEIGKAMGEAQVPAVEQGGAGQMDKSRALAKVAELKMDNNFTKALGDPSHPGHKDAKAQWDNLFAIAYPDGKE